MPRYIIGMCPNPVIDNSVEARDTGKSVRVQKKDGNYEISIFMCPSGTNCYEGLEVSIGMCPTGLTCGCEYIVDDLEFSDNGSCHIYITWTNPDKCLCKSIHLQRLQWWDELVYQHKYSHVREGEDADMLIYSDGDVRNDHYCFPCGIGGDESTHSAGSESIFETQNLNPGQIYRVIGYFDDLSCGGSESVVVLGHLLYQTTGFTSGKITAVVSTDPPMYTVEYYKKISHGAEAISKDLYSSDNYPWEVGDYVMLGKLAANFPDGYYGTHLTSENIEQKGAGDSPETELFIIPYSKIEG